MDITISVDPLVIFAMLITVVAVVGMNAIIRLRKGA